MNDERRFATLVRALAETFGVPLTEGQLLGYRMGLEGLRLAEIETAVSVAMKECEFMPKPATLRDLAREAAREAMRAKALPALETEAQKEQILASWRGTEDEVKRMLDAMPRGPAHDIASSIARTAREGGQ